MGVKKPFAEPIDLLRQKGSLHVNGCVHLSRGGEPPEAGAPLQRCGRLLRLEKWARPHWQRALRPRPECEASWRRDVQILFSLPDSHSNGWQPLLKEVWGCSWLLGFHMLIMLALRVRRVFAVLKPETVCAVHSLSWLQQGARTGCLS